MSDDQEWSAFNVDDLVIEAVGTVTPPPDHDNTTGED